MAGYYHLWRSGVRGLGKSRCHVAPDQLAILANVTLLHLIVDGVIAGQLLIEISASVNTVRVNEAPEGQCGDLIGIVAEHLPQRQLAVDDPVMRVQYRDADSGPVKHRTELGTRCISRLSRSHVPERAEAGAPACARRLTMLEIIGLPRLSSRRLRVRAQLFLPEVPAGTFFSTSIGKSRYFFSGKEPSVRRLHVDSHGWWFVSGECHMS